MKKTIIPIILIISIVILVIATISINKLIIEDVKQGLPKQSEETQVSITGEVKKRLGNGKLDILIKVESNTEIENVTFPNEDGSTITVTTDKLRLAKDLKGEVEKEYPVIVKTKDGKVTNETIKIDSTMADFVKVGDFVNYRVGNWTNNDIAMLSWRYSGSSMPTTRGYFGGFGTNTSKDNSIYDTTYKTGWRVLSLNADGTVSIMHAGLPMAFCWKANTLNDWQMEEVLATWSYFKMFEDTSSDSVDTSFAVPNSAHCITRSEVYGLSESQRAVGCKYILPECTGSNALPWGVMSNGMVTGSSIFGRRIERC